MSKEVYVLHAKYEGYILGVYNTLEQAKEAEEKYNNPEKSWDEFWAGTGMITARILNAEPDLSDPASLTR